MNRRSDPLQTHRRNRDSLVAQGSGSLLIFLIVGERDTSYLVLPMQTLDHAVSDAVEKFCVQKTSVD